MTHDELIAVIAAHRDGKEIEARFREESYGSGPMGVFFGKWESFTRDKWPLWDTYRWDYRIKPMPKMRPIRVDELPYIFETLEGDRNTIRSTHLWRRDDFSGQLIERGIKIRATYTTDGVTWCPFDIEE